MNRFTNKRLAELEKRVVPIGEAIPRITPDMSVEEAMSIWTRTLHHHNRLPPAFSDKEIEEVRRGRTDEELAEHWAKICRGTEEEVRRKFGSPAAAAQADGEAD